MPALTEHEVWRREIADTAARDLLRAQREAADTRTPGERRKDVAMRVALYAAAAVLLFVLWWRP